ncbi:MAG: hypothetical protein M1825_002236 [Sarcosagium campestre]|nr:MAG: hypothetical protein M1825_002236 [Sarcosagium campestre]
MSSLSVVHCSTCLRRCVASTKPSPTFLQQQVRGKKKLAKRLTLPVRLLRDVSGYGPKGALVSVTLGQMRNDWFPARRAEYLTDTQLKSLGPGQATIERDFGFRAHQKLSEDWVSRGDAGRTVVEAELTLLSPDRSIQVLSTLLPSSLTFYRPAISPSPSAGGPIGIYGSVSTTDIVTSIRALLSDNEEGSRVVLAPEDVKFITNDDAHPESDRVKYVASYQIEIKPKGSTTAVRRIVEVKAQVAEEDGT